MNTQKVLIVGNITGHFRSQIFIQKLIQKDIGSKKNFVVSIANPKSFLFNNCKNKIVKYFFNTINIMFFFMELLIKIPLSHKIYFMAMNHKYFPYVIFANAIWKRPIIADFYVSVYDSAKNRLQINNSVNNRIKILKIEWYYKMLDRLLIEKAKKTVIVNEFELKLISLLVNANINKCNYEIIPLTSYPKRISNPSYSEKFRICWWGTYTPFHGVDNIIKAAKMLKDANINFSLSLFGTPHFNPIDFKNMVKELLLDEEITFHMDKTFGNGLLEKNLVSNCDLALGNFSSSERALRTIPSKIIDCFSMCLPVLTMNTKVLESIIDVDNELFTCGINPEEICEEIIKIMNNKQEKERRANNGFIHYEKTFSVKAVQEKFIKLFL